MAVKGLINLSPKDFMKEMEQHTEDYGQLRTYGNSLAAKYKPSDALDEMMSSLHHQWEE